MPELAPAPTPTAPQVVIQNVEHLHIHVGPEAIEGLSHLMANSWVLEGSAIGTQTQERHTTGSGPSGMTGLTRAGRCPEPAPRKRGVDGALTLPPRARAVPPVRNTPASPMQSPPASAEATSS